MAQAPRKAGARAPAQEPKPARGSRSVAKTTGSREVTNWEEELERQAQIATGMEKGAAMGRSFSFKGGTMMFDGAQVKDNKVIVIVAAACIEKAFYDGRYDPDNPEPPICFAFNTDPEDLAPKPDDVADLQSETCAECPHNVFGSADTGRGKACKDVRRLALIPAGNFVKGDVELVQDLKALEKAELGFAKLPPTSLNAYAAFVRQVASTMKRPPHGVYAIMECVPDSKNQFSIQWEVLDLVPAKVLGVIMKRHEEAMEAIQLPYNYPDPAEQGRRPKPSARGRGAKPDAKPGRGRAPAPRGKAQGRSRKY